MKENTFKDMSNLLNKSFSTTLKQKRAEYGYTIAVAAAKCGISEREFSHLENGENLPSIQTLFNIAIAFKVDLNAIVESVIKQGYIIIDKLK